MKTLSLLLLICAGALTVAPVGAATTGYPNGNGWQAVEEDLVEVHQRLDAIDQTTIDTNERVHDIQLDLDETNDYAATPVLVPPTDGRVSCGIANVSSVNSVRVTISIYDFFGTENFGPVETTLLPLTNVRSAPFLNDDRASHCVVTVIDGRARDIRISLMAYDSDDNLVTAVNGQ